MVKIVIDQVRAELASLSEGNTLLEESLQRLTGLAQELREQTVQGTISAGGDGTEEFRVEDIEATIAEARKDLEQGRTAQDAFERMLAAGNVFYPHSQVNRGN